MISNSAPSNRGFSLIEVIVAFAVFSVAFVLIVTAFIQSIKMYQAGLASSSTQQNARLIVDELSRSVRMASGIEINNSEAGDRICLSINGSKIIYAIDGDMNLRRGTNQTTACDVAPIISDSWEMINDSQAQVSRFGLSRTPARRSSAGTLQIEVITAARLGLAYMDSSHMTCTGVGRGSEYCSVTKLGTTVGVVGSLSVSP